MNIRWKLVEELNKEQKRQKTVNLLSLFFGFRTVNFGQFVKIKYSLYTAPRGPRSHILMTGAPKDFFGSEILAKRDLFGSMKDAGIFWGRENNTGIFLGIVFFISSNQQ